MSCSSRYRPAKTTTTCRCEQGCGDLGWEAPLVSRAVSRAGLVAVSRAVSRAASREI